MSETILVSGQVELQTLVFGWYMYDQLWMILQDTGLAFLPFLAMILNNFIEPIKTAYTTSAAQLSLKRVEWDLIRMLIVIVLAGQPFIDISLGGYGLLELCKKDGSDNFIALEKLRKEAKEIKSTEQIAPIGKGKKATVPLWWYAVMSVSTGFTEAAKASVPCVNDFRQILADTLAGGVISGTDSINAEILSFINECYRPAKVEYEKIDGDSYFETCDSTKDFCKNAKEIKKGIEENGKGSFSKDVSHVGSVFLHGMGARRGDARDAASGDGWPDKQAADKSVMVGEGKYYDRLIQIPGWNGDKEIPFVSCRQWWGMSGQGEGHDLFSPSATTGGWNFYSKVVTFLGGYKDKERFKITDGDWDGIVEESTEGRVPFNVMRQLSFRIIVLLAVSSGIVHFQSLPGDKAGIYISPGDYSGLALDSILAAKRKHGNVEYSVKRIAPGISMSLGEALTRVNTHYYLGENDEGALEARNAIQKYIEDHVMKGSMVSETPGQSATGYAEKIKKGAASFGLAVAALGTYVTAYIARTSFPYIQALTLCGIYIFLSIGLVFAGYTLEFMYAGAMAIFTLKFMAFIFYLCAWLDNNLIVLVTGKTIWGAISTSMMPSTGGWVAGTAATLLLGPLGAAAFAIGTVLKGLYDNTELLMVDYATAGLYFTLPSLFAVVMGWAGVKGAEAIGEMQKAAQPMVQAGQQGVQMAQRMAGGAVSTAGGIVSGKAGVLGGGVVGGLASKIAGRTVMTGQSKGKA